MSNIILKANEVSKSFAHDGGQVHVLTNVNLDIYEGDFTVIMGASGSGKSTLLYALSGMDTPTLGSIYYGETDITKLDQNNLALFRRDNSGFVFQSIYLIESMSVLDNVLCAGLLTNKNKKEVVESAKVTLKSVDIEESLFDKFPNQMSGGEAQRVGIARALINKPLILFADEPTGALNSKTGKDVLDTLTKANLNGQTIVMVTHDIVSARRANRILYIKDGEIAGELNLGKYIPHDSERHQKLNDFLVSMGW